MAKTGKALTKKRGGVWGGGAEWQDQAMGGTLTLIPSKIVSELVMNNVLEKYKGN